MKTSEIKIKGMSCNHCVASIQKALSALEGVKVLMSALKTKWRQLNMMRPKQKKAFLKM